MSLPLFLFLYHCRLWKPTWHRRTVTGSMPMRWGQTQTPTVYSPEWMVTLVSVCLCQHRYWYAAKAHTNTWNHRALSLCVISHLLRLAAHHLFLFYLGCLWDRTFIWYCIIALPFCVHVGAYFPSLYQCLWVWHWPKWSSKVAVTAQNSGALCEYRIVDCVFIFVASVLHFHWFKVIWR